MTFCLLQGEIDAAAAVPGDGDIDGSGVDRGIGLSTYSAFLNVKIWSGGFVVVVEAYL